MPRTPANLATSDHATLSVRDSTGRLVQRTHPAIVYLDQLNSPHSRRAALQGLRRMAALALHRPVDEVTPDDVLRFPWWELEREHAQHLRQELVQRYAPQTANVALSAFRGLLKEAWMMDLISEKQYKLLTTIKSVTSHELPPGRPLTEGEIMALLRVCHDRRSVGGLKDAAIITLGYGCGLRRSEISKLLDEHVDAECRTVRVRQGKGRKDRDVPVPVGGQRILRKWRLVKPAGGHFIRAVNKSDRILDHGVSPQAIYNMLERRAKEAGVQRFTPHDLRHTYVTTLLTVTGGDYNLVRYLTGHANFETLAIYDRRQFHEAAHVVDHIHVPVFDW